MFGVDCNFLVPILPAARIRTLRFDRSAISELYYMGHTFLTSFSNIDLAHKSRMLRVQMNLRAPSATNEKILHALQNLALQLSKGVKVQCVFRDPETYLQMFSHLFRIPNITTLHISFASAFLLDDPRHESFAPPTFPSLQNLRLFGCSVDFVIDVLRASPAHQLRLIRVSLDPFYPAMDIAPLVQVIVERCDKEVLRVLVIKSVRLPGEVVKEMDKLRPLRVFKKLTTSYFNRARFSSADLEADVIPGCTTATPTT
ncbi:hypothetical protein EV121DRAFT_281785 [Schizophyllum commune]